MYRELATLGSFVVFVGCGGLAPSEDAGADAGSDTSATTCIAADETRVCGGPNHCPTDPLKCGTPCVVPADASDGTVGLCQVDIQPTYCGWSASDGTVCIDTDYLFAGDWRSSSFDLGALLAANGAASRVRYADLGLWTGSPLPDPGTCPVLVNGQLCGGSCGGCPNGFICHGRSPLHPAGICVPTTGPSANDTCVDPDGGVASCHVAGDKCFTYTVEAEAQPLSDTFSFCLPSSFCDELSQKLPGGASCK